MGLTDTGDVGATDRSFARHLSSLTGGSLMKLSKIFDIKRRLYDHQRRKPPLATFMDRLNVSVPILGTSMVLLLAAALHWGLTRPKRSKYPYPPGPKPKILLGNLLDIPAKNMSKVYVEWGKRYQSKVISFSKGHR
jgi:hypothetical protein